MIIHFKNKTLKSIMMENFIRQNGKYLIASENYTNDAYIHTSKLLKFFPHEIIEIMRVS